MREIKFRRIQKGDTPRDYSYFTLYPLDEGCSAVSLVIYKGDIVHQYTGLKDKNDKEIYEGDVVKVTYEPPVGDDITFIATVELDETFTGYKLEYDSGSVGIGLALDDSSDIEVIGNVYENLELLEGTK